MGAYITLGDYMNDEILSKVEKKTKVDKNALIALAKKVEENGLKDEKTLREVINKLSVLTGKNVSNELEDKIINTILEDRVPKNIDKLF